MKSISILYMKAALVPCLVMFCIGSAGAQTKNAGVVDNDSYSDSGVAVNPSTLFATNEDPLATDLFAGILKIRTAELIEQGDSLKLKMELRINRKAIGKRQSWAIVPQLITDEEEQITQITFPYALVNGGIRKQLYQRKLKFGNKELLSNLPIIEKKISRRTVVGDDEVLFYTVSVPYEPWMDVADLRLHAVLVSPAGTRRLLTIENAGKVAFASRTPYQVQPRANFVVPDPEQKQRKMQGQAYLDFQVGCSMIIPTFRRNPEELAKIAQTVLKVKSNPDVQITGLFVEGYASPDGSYALNERLSRERANALRDYMVKTYGLDGELFRVSSVAEDWSGFRSLVQESSMSEANKQQVLTVIESTNDNDAKERRLRSMGAVWGMVNTEMFPQLRRVEYQIDFAVKDYTLEESKALANRDPELLSQRELYLLAMNYPEGSKEREQAFEQIRRLYPDDATAMINEAAIMLQNGEYTGAKRLLERVGDDPRALNNMGVCLLVENETDKAGEYLEKAASQGIDEATHNLEELQKKRKDNEKMRRYKND